MGVIIEARHMNYIGTQDADKDLIPAENLNAGDTFSALDTGLCYIWDGLALAWKLSIGITGLYNVLSPAGNDYGIGAGLTKDGGWHTLDISAKVPAGTIAVNLYIYTAGASVGNDTIVAKTSTSYGQSSRIQNPATYREVSFVVPVYENDGVRSIDYMINVNISECYYTIMGYYL